MISHHLQTITERLERMINEFEEEAGVLVYSELDGDEARVNIAGEWYRFPAIALTSDLEGTTEEFQRYVISLRASVEAIARHRT